MKSSSSLSIVIALMVSSAPALAQAEMVLEPAAPQEYEFEDQLVPGDLIRPQGETLIARKRASRQSLVEVRTSYLPELLMSVEDL